MVNSQVLLIVPPNIFHIYPILSVPKALAIISVLLSLCLSHTLSLLSLRIALLMLVLPHSLACEKSHHHPVPREDTHLHQVPEHTENLQQEFLIQEENLM